jgi:hypothetical protein
MVPRDLYCRPSRTPDPRDRRPPGGHPAGRGRPRDVPPAPQRKAPEALTLGDALEEYEGRYKKNRREAEANPLVSVLRHFIEPLGEDFDTKAVTRDHVQRWADGRVAGRAPTTVKRDFAWVRAFIYWLARRKGAADMNSCRTRSGPRPWS